MEAVSEATDLDELFENALDCIIDALDPERTFILYGQNDMGLWLTRTSHGIEEPDRLLLSGEISRQPLRHVLEDGEPVMLLDAPENPNYSGRMSVAISGIRSVVCVGLRDETKQVVGLLYADDRQREGVFLDDNLVWLLQLAEVVSARLSVLEKGELPPTPTAVEEATTVLPPKPVEPVSAPLEFSIPMPGTGDGPGPTPLELSIPMPSTDGAKPVEPKPAPAAEPETPSVETKIEPVAVINKIESEPVKPARPRPSPRPRPNLSNRPELTRWKGLLKNAKQLLKDGRVTRAATELSLALREAQRRTGEESYEVGKTLRVMAKAHRIQNRVEKSREELELAAKIFGQHSAELELSRVLYTLGQSYYSEDDHTKAADYFRRALELWEEHDVRHRLQSIALVRLGEIHNKAGELEQAEAVFQRAHLVSQKALGDDDPNTRRTKIRCDRAKRALAAKRG